MSETGQEGAKPSMWAKLKSRLTPGKIVEGVGVAAVVAGGAAAIKTEIDRNNAIQTYLRDDNRVAQTAPSSEVPTDTSRLEGNVLTAVTPEGSKNFPLKGNMVVKQRPIEGYSSDMLPPLEVPEKVAKQMLQKPQTPEFIKGVSPEKNVPVQVEEDAGQTQGDMDIPLQAPEQAIK